MIDSTRTATGLRPLGELLVEEGALDPQQLSEALEHARRRGLKLGQALLELELVDEARLAAALSRQGRLYCIELSPALVDPACARRLDRAFARERRCIAINRIAGVTTVAMEDPTDLETLEDVARSLGTPVIAVHADPRRVEECLELAWALQPGEEPEQALPRASGALHFPAGIEDHEPLVEEEGLEGPVSNLIRALISEAVELRASAVHFEPRERRFVVRMRVDGALHERLSLARGWARPCVARLELLCGLTGAGEAPRHGAAHCVFRGEELLLHAVSAPGAHGRALVLRLEGRRSGRRALSELGAEPAEEELLRALVSGRGGLVLVAGPVGSGRRTTVRALLAELDRPERKLVAIERCALPAPESATVIALGEELERAPALRSALGQDADAIALDLLEDADSAALALRGALEGRFVLAATAAADPAEALARLVDLGLRPQLVADALVGVVAQRLVRRPCAACGDDASEPQAERCRECRATGHRGRLALFEIAPALEPLRAALRAGGDANALRCALRAAGVPSLRERGLERARRGDTTLAEVLAHTPEEPA